MSEESKDALADVRALGAWMREHGAVEVQMPGGLRIVLGAPPPSAARDTLKEQAANAEAKRRYDEAMMFAATEGLPGDVGDFGKFE